jgi:hypothetical protein
MTIGIEQFRDPRELRLDRMLVQPFREDAGPYPIGRGPDKSDPAFAPTPASPTEP